MLSISGCKTHSDHHVCSKFSPCHGRATLRSSVHLIRLVPGGGKLLHHVGLVNWRPPPRHLRELSVVEVLQRGRVDGQTRVGGHARVVHPEARRVQGVDFGEGRLLRSPKLSETKKTLKVV